MSKGKSKRFVKQGADAAQKHYEKFPYRMTLAEAELRKSRGGSL